MYTHKVWRKFDRDSSGFIEADELKQFIKTLIQNSGKNSLTEEKLIEYADTIVNIELIYYFVFIILSILFMRAANI